MGRGRTAATSAARAAGEPFAGIPAIGGQRDRVGDRDDHRHLEIDLSAPAEPALALEQLEALGELATEGALLRVEARLAVLAGKLVVKGQRVAEGPVAELVGASALDEAGRVLGVAPLAGLDRDVAAGTALAAQADLRPAARVEVDRRDVVPWPQAQCR